MDRSPHPPKAAQPQSTVPPELSAAGFCAVAQALAAVAGEAGLEVPTFRSPPRTPGVVRAVKRRSSGGACVLVRRAGLPVADAIEAMVEGVVVATRVEAPTAVRLRTRLMAAAWAALDAPAGAVVAVVADRKRGAAA